MLKRLPFLCAALLALAACGQSADHGTAAPGTPAATGTAAAKPATPATAGTATPTATTSAPASASSATAASTAAPATATTVATAKPAAPAQPFVDNGQWVEGKNYFLVQPAQPTDHPDKVVLTEVFSYGCPACYEFHTWMDKLVAGLPSNVVVEYVPASWHPEENWPLYQRVYFAAKTLGVADKTYDAMFDAAWKTGELATDDLTLGRPKPASEWPKLEDFAKFYAKYGVNPAQFIGVANSFSVNLAMKRADDQVRAFGADSTPTLVVDGKYRLTPVSAGGYDKTLALTKWLIAKAAAGK